MKIKDALMILGVLAAFFLCGYIFGRCSAERSKERPATRETGILTADNLRPIEVNEPDEMLFVDPETQKGASGSRILHPAVVSRAERATQTQEKAQKTAQTTLQARAQGVPEKTIRPIQPGDDTLRMALATVRDWNLERVYSGTLFDNEQSGRMDYTAAVQRNTLTRFSYDYRPAPVKVKHNRVRPYIRGHIDTRGAYGASVGALYKWFGADAGIIRYAPDKYAVSLGVMVVF